MDEVGHAGDRIVLAADDLKGAAERPEDEEVVERVPVDVPTRGHASDDVGSVVPGTGHAERRRDGSEVRGRDRRREVRAPGTRNNDVA